MEEEEKSYFHEVTWTDSQGQTRTSQVPVAQELARQGIHHLPHRFIHNKEGHHESHHPTTHLQIPPSINMENLRAVSSNPDRHAQEMASLAQGAREWGLIFVTGHSIPSTVIRSLEDVVKGFFGLSFEEKKKSVGSYASVDNLGYGRSFVKSDDQPLDWIDRLAMRITPKNSTDGLRVWPQEPTNFRRAMEDFVEEARRVLDEILISLAKALMLDEQSFIRHFRPSDSVINVRVNCYPPCPRPELALGLNPHTDGSSLSLILQVDSKEGLEVFKDGQWIRIPAPPGSLLIGVGDLLEIMSNGSFESPWHRVVPHKDWERLSVTLFYYPPFKEEIGPVDGDGIGLLGEPRYKKVVVEDYVRHYYKVSPTKEKQAIMYAKLS